MTELVTTIRDYAGWLYALLLVLAVRELLAIRRAERERRRAMFSLERDAAASRAVRSLVMLLLLLTMGAGVYTVAELVAPNLPTMDTPTVVVPTRPPDRSWPTAEPLVTRVPTRRLPLIVTATPTAGAGQAATEATITPPPAKEGGAGTPTQPF